MLSMTLASLGWGTWWVVLLLRRMFDLTPGLTVPSFVSSVFAVAGLAVAVWCLRARRSWLLFVMIPFLANLALLFMPWLAQELLAGKS
jgi:hypothetical protein